MATTMTKKEMFAVIRTANFEGCSVSASAILDFIDHEIELLNKKSGAKKKPSANQTENENIKVAILDYLTETGEKLRTTDILNTVPACKGLSFARVNALMKQLSGGTTSNGTEPVERVVEKKITYFKARNND